MGRLTTVEVVTGGASRRLLFDSGGGETLVSPGVASAAGCSPSGRSTGVRMSGEHVEWPLCRDLTLRVDSLSVVDETAGVWDIMSVLPDGLPALDGLVSLETFRGHLLTMDLAGSRLIVETEESFEARIRDMDPVPMRLATGHEGSHLTVLLRGTVEPDGPPLWFLMDSANLAETLLSPHAFPGEGGEEATVRLGPSTIVSGPVRELDNLYDGVLSEQMLRQVVVSLDLEAGLAWVAPASAS